MITEITCEMLDYPSTFDDYYVDKVAYKSTRFKPTIKN